MSDNIGVRVTGDVTDLQRALAHGGASVKQFSTQAGRDLDHVGDKAKKAGEHASMLESILGLLAAKFAAGVGWKAATGELTKFESVMVDATTAAQKLTNTLTFAVGKESAARDMVFLRDTTRTLGLEFISTSQQYARLAAASRGTNMEGNNTRELFEAIAQASAGMGMSVEETEGALRAVQQMMSKGKVQAEELRGQLGERLPGAFQIAARSMGVTTGQLDKMLETGAVMADEFLPRFAAQLKKELGGSVAEAAQSAQAATNRYTNAYTEFKQALADTGVYDFIARRQAVVAESFSTMAKAMREAKAEGKGFFGQLFSAFGADISLTNPLDGISMSVKENAIRLKEARARLQELQAQSEVLGNNIYWKAERAEITDYIARLEKALGLKKQLTPNEQGAIASGEAIRGQYPTRSQNYEEHARREAQSRASLDSIRQRLSGQSEGYQRTLQELYRLYVNGTIKTTEEYRRYVTELIEREGGVKKGDKKANPADAVFKSISERAAELRQEISLEQDLTAAQKLASKVLDDMRTGTLKLTEAEKGRMGLALRDLLTQDQANTQREAANKLQAENARIIEKNTEAAERASAQRIKALEGEIQTNDKLREEISLIGLGDDARTRRLQLIEQEAIARLELDLVMARNIEGNEAEVSAIEREIKLRRERVGLLGEKGAREGFAKIEEEGAKAAEDIRGNLTDALMRGFEDGKDLAENFRDTLKNMTFTLGIRPVMQALATPIANGISSFFGGGAASAAGTGAVQGGMSSLAGSAIGSAIMGGASAFGSGVMSGLTAWGAGGSVTGLLGTGSALFSGGLMSGLGTIAGALGPIALGIAAIMSFVKDRGGPKVDGQFNPFAGYDMGVGRGGGELNSGASQLALGLQAQYDSIVRAAGGRGGVQFGVGLSTDPQGTSPSFVQVAAGRNGQAFAESVNLNVGRDEASLNAALQAQSKEVLLAALKASDLPALFAGLIDSDLDKSIARITAASEMQAQINLLSLPALERVAALRQQELDALDPLLRGLADELKAKQERATLEERLFAATHTEQEVLLRTRELERAALSESNRALLDQIYAQEDLRRATEASTAAIAAADRVRAAAASVRGALADIAGNVQSFADAARSAAADLGDARNAISEALFEAEDAQTAAQQRVNDIVRERIKSIDEFLGELAGGGGTESLTSLKARLSATSVLAAGGDSQAQANLLTQARAVLKAAEAGSSTRADYSRQEAFVRQQLLMVRGAGVDYLKAAPGGSNEPLGELEAALADLAQATERTTALIALAQTAGAATDRSLRDAAGSITILSAAYHQALSASTQAQNDYSSALLVTQGLHLATGDRFAGLNASLADLGRANLDLFDAMADAVADSDELADQLAAQFGLTGAAAEALAQMLGEPASAATTLATLLGAPGTSAAALASALGLTGTAASEFIAAIGTSTLAAGSIFVDANGVIKAAAAGVFADVNGGLVVQAGAVFKDVNGRVLLGSGGVWDDVNDLIKTGAGGVFMDANGVLRTAAGVAFDGVNSALNSAGGGVFDGVNAALGDDAGGAFDGVNTVLGSGAGGVFQGIDGILSTGAAGVASVFGTLVGDLEGVSRAIAALSFSGPSAPEPTTPPATTYTDQQIRDYIAWAAPGGGTEQEIVAIYNAAQRFGISSSRIDTAMSYAPGTALRMALERGLPAFADGGDHSGGLAWVGERGRELADFRQPARIYSAAQSRALLDTQRLERLVEQLLARIDAMSRDAAATARATGDTSHTLQKLSYGGTFMNVKQVTA